MSAETPTPLEMLERIRPNQFALVPTATREGGPQSHAALIVGGEGKALNQRAAIILDADHLLALAVQCLTHIAQIRASSKVADSPRIVVPELQVPPILNGAN